jgi:hypothetical protein
MDNSDAALQQWFEHMISAMSLAADMQRAGPGMPDVRRLERSLPPKTRAIILPSNYVRDAYRLANHLANTGRAAALEEPRGEFDAHDVAAILRHLRAQLWSPPGGAKPPHGNQQAPLGFVGMGGKPARSELPATFMSSRDLARFFGLNEDRTESALRRFRDKNPSCVVTVEDRHPGEPQILYRFINVRALLEDMVNAV